MIPLVPRVGAAVRGAAAVTLLVLAAGCTGSGTIPGASPSGAPPTPPAPEAGACRILTPDDVAQPANDSPTVECGSGNTAQTFAVGDLPARFADVEYDDPRLSRFAFKTCSTGFAAFLGADQSLALRTSLSWAWFRPTTDEWADGARWYRCDVLGGGEQSVAYAELPADLEGVLLGAPDDRFLACAVGETIDGSVKVPCSQEHDWRAVTTIVLGKPGDEFPGDRVVEVRSRDYCSDSVGAWLNYPAEYDFGFTWFREADWEGGNRRSVCWARTSQ